MWNELKATGAGWVRGAGAGAILIGWGGGTVSCVLGGPEEGEKEKLVGGL